MTVNQKFQLYSTNINSKHYHYDQKKFLENFPVSQENLHCMSNWYKNRDQGLVPASIRHSVFANSTGLLVAFWKFHTYSTDSHALGHKSSKKDFSRNFPIFQENLHCVQNFDKNGFSGTLKCDPMIM